MSREALQAYQEARHSQLQRNEARHIRTRVHEARQAPHIAALRWPFELLQNALDAGPRADQSSVAVAVRQDGHQVVFEHDGAPFSSEELAALLSGGSSKEFGSDEVTGRFGTGFLVTHVLAERTLLEGVLAVDDRYERFRLELDRGGDEEEILRNIDLCNAAIERAEPLADLAGVPSARFTYPLDSDSTPAIGLDAFRASLPYLYGTRPALGSVTFVDEEDATETWSGGLTSTIDLPDCWLQERAIVVSRSAGDRDLRILRFSSSSDAHAAALVLVERDAEGGGVVVPGDGQPRVYCQYPLRASNFVPTEFVLDGKIEPDQERSRALMNDRDRELLEDALKAAAAATRYSSDQGWGRAHLLAHAAPPASAFDPDDVDEIEWWRSAMRAFATNVSRLPIVETTRGRLPSTSDEGAYADFILPRLVATSTTDETEIDRLWPLVNDASDLCPPIRPVAVDWSRIAAGWFGLGLEPNMITVGVVADYVRNGASSLEELRVDSERLPWLARFLDVVGECWERRSGIDTSVLEGILPNQNDSLCNPRDLRRDEGVSGRLKDVCSEAGLDVRNGLLSGALCEFASRRGLEHAQRAIESAIPTAIGGDGIVGELIAHLGDVLPPETDCTPDNANVQQAVVHLLQYLWEAHGSDANQTARRVPLITRSRKAAQWTSMMMAPVRAWHESAQEFSDAYPLDRILDDLYVNEGAALVDALDAWDMAWPDPLRRSTVLSLEGNRLAGMVFDEFDSDGVTIRGEAFSEIALLPREVINHIQDVDQGKALLGLVLCHAAPHDRGWRERRVVRGFRAREPVDVPVRGAVWVGDLRSRAWVPVRGEDDKPAKAAADASTLKPLLDPAWVDGNDAAIALLTECFGFDELDLRLLGIAPEAQHRVRLGLARLLEAGRGDPEFYEALAQEVEVRQQRSRDVERSRRMGYAVQHAVRLALEAQGLEVALIDRGFDFEVSLASSEDLLAEAAMRFEVGPYWIEVKATSTGPARLTPTQAHTASENASRYVLCVVDVRAIEADRLDKEWSAKDVEPLMHFVSGIGDRVVDTWELVREARERTVGIRNDAALRYEVPTSVWKGGCSIGEWVASIAPTGASEDDGA